MKKTTVLLSSLLASATIFASTTQAAENQDSSNLEPYSYSEVMDSTFASIPDEIKNMDSLEAEDGKDYLTEQEVTALTVEQLDEINRAIEQETQGGTYTEEELNQMAANKIKEEVKEQAKVEKPQFSLMSYDYSIPGFGSLTEKEKSLAAQHPAEFTQYSAAAVRAKDEAEKYYGSSQLYLGNGDAFRHAYWNALLVRSFGGTTASTKARTRAVSRAEVWTNAHEQYSSGVDKEMDMYNNEVGRYYAYTYYYLQTRADVSSGLRKMVNQGTMCRVVNGTLVKTTSATGK